MFNLFGFVNGVMDRCFSNSEVAAHILVFVSITDIEAFQFVDRSTFELLSADYVWRLLLFNRFCFHDFQQGLKPAYCVKNSSWRETYCSLMSHIPSSRPKIVFEHSDEVLDVQVT